MQTWTNSNSGQILLQEVIYRSNKPNMLVFFFSNSLIGFLLALVQITFPTNACY